MTYVNDYEVKAFVTNLGKYVEGQLVGEWVTFPIDEIEQDEMLKRIGIGEEYEEIFVTDYDSELPLYEEFGEYPDLEELNEFAEEIESMSEHDIKHMLALKEYHGASESLKDCIDMLRDSELYEDISPEDYMEQRFEDTEYEFMRALDTAWFRFHVDIDWRGIFDDEDGLYESEYGILAMY